MCRFNFNELSDSYSNEMGLDNQIIDKLQKRLFVPKSNNISHFEILCFGYFPAPLSLSHIPLAECATLSNLGAVPNLVKVEGRRLKWCLSCLCYSHYAKTVRTPITLVIYCICLKTYPRLYQKTWHFFSVCKISYALTRHMFHSVWAQSLS